MTHTQDEAARQRALDTYRIVDSLPEAAYDDIARLASAICAVPVALVSLIDRDRQWFKARVGMDRSETPRDVALCDHAIREPTLLMEVADAKADARFAGNPLVSGEGGIRFYAGMPLVTPGGAAIGTVCVIDQVPRELTPLQRDALAALARLTMNLMEGRAREREFERAALFATVSANEQVAPSVAAGACTVMIVELQDQAGVARQRGERAIERLLERLQSLIETNVDHARGDCVTRVSGSAEIVVVLHRDDVQPCIDAIRQAVSHFETETGLVVLSAAASAGSSGDAAPDLFLRADATLSRLKDERAGIAAVA